MNLCIAAERRPVSHISKLWWEQQGLDLEGVWTTARRAEQEEGEKETGGMVWDGDGDGKLIRWGDTVSNAILGTDILGTDYNALLAYTLGLELHHPIIGMLGGHRGRLDRDRDMTEI